MKSYEAPVLQAMGTVSELTQFHHHHHQPIEKNYNPVSDGFEFQHESINFS